MDYFNAYNESIAISVIIILSYFFSFISKKTKIPTVLLLIGLGIGIQKLLLWAEVPATDLVMEALELFGVVGLIMIVLEAALDLELKREKTMLLVKAFFMALLSLGATTLAIGYLFHALIMDDWFTAFLYAVPLSILSSAIIIPSVSSLVDSKREFMIYESTFSDILGIMLFYFMIDGKAAANTIEVATHITSSILMTVVVSLIASYALVILLQKLKSGVKLFFLISVLVFLYSGGKLLHLSSLLIILVFGLVLNNYKLFFKGKLYKLINADMIDEMKEDFHMVTKETAFVVRTFFFVIFGMTLNFSGITDINALLIAAGVLLATYIIRFVFLKFFGGKSILPQLWIAPRGLITVLLFFSIPAQFIQSDFNPTILLVVILASSFIMTGGLMAKKEDFEEKEELVFDSWEELDKEVEAGINTPSKTL